METSRKSGRQRLAADGDWDDAAQRKGRGKSKRRAFFICRTLRGYPQRGRKGTKQVRQHYRTSKKGKTYTVKAHTRKFTMPQRQFVGDGKRTQEIIKGVIADNVSNFDRQLVKFIKK